MVTFSDNASVAHWVIVPEVALAAVVLAVVAVPDAVGVAPAAPVAVVVGLAVGETVELLSAVLGVVEDDGDVVIA
ncbi:MAG TPA: hypothetical protein VHC41_04870 [Mycobacteriales bacterium]|nr:hypothetical protein [Mycobacteriales bacterium]